MEHLNVYQQAKLDAALRYAEKGWAVLPVSRRRKLLNANGCAGATRDARQIAEWWRTYPNAQVGIATGAISGIWVVAVEQENNRHGMDALVRKFGDRFTLKRKTLIQRTPTGGFHFAFAWEDTPKIITRRNVLDGVDIWSDDGFIVAAPSSNLVGRQWVAYQWNNLDYRPLKAPGWACVLKEYAQIFAGRRTKPSNLIDANVKFARVYSRYQRLLDVSTLVKTDPNRKIA